MSAHPHRLKRIRSFMVLADDELRAIKADFLSRIVEIENLQSKVTRFLEERKLFAKD